MTNDYISRAVGIIGLAASSLTPRQIDDAAEALQLVPAADVVEVRHSHWNEEGLSLVCANCGWMQYHDIPYGYCPNCGAKMDGGQDNG